jgi:hypothetical protein
MVNTAAKENSIKVVMGVKYISLHALGKPFQKFQCLYRVTSPSLYPGKPQYSSLFFWNKHGLICHFRTVISSIIPDLHCISALSLL